MPDKAGEIPPYSLAGNVDPFFPMKRNRLVFLLAIGLVSGWSAWLILRPSVPPAKDDPGSVPQPPAVVMPDLRLLAAQMSRAEPAPEEIEEEQRVVRQQVETAHGWLNDADSGQRVAGAEQLSAFPTPEAERYLTEALGYDPAPEVRAAAAQSLGMFDELQDGTLLTLLDALADREEDVRRSALYALESNYQRLERDSPAAKKLLSDLERKAKSKRVAKDTRDLIREFVREQK